MRSALFFLAFAAFSLQSGESLRCWTCSSDVNPHCNDPFHNDGSLMAQDCNRNRSPSPYSTDYAACRKVVEKVNNEKVIIRACSWVHSKEDEHCASKNIHLPSGYEFVSCDSCESDECNSAHFVTSSAALVLALLAAKLLA